MSTDADPSASVDFIAGTVGGVASLLAGHPFDTIKTRLQSQVIPSTAQNGVSAPVYRNAMDAFRIIFVGLYKGVTSPLLGVAIMNASVFGCYSLALRAQMGANTSIDNASLGQIMLAGMASGVMTALITTPIDLLKIRQQNDTRTATSSNTFSVIRNIVLRQGFTGLFRGYGATCIRDLGYGPYFFTYELLNRTLLSFHTSASLSASDTVADLALGTSSNTSPRLSPIELAISGGLAGMVGWGATFWADVIKTRIQATEATAKREAPSSPPSLAPVSTAENGAISRSVQPAVGTAAAASRSKAPGLGSAETDRLLDRSQAPSGGFASWLARRSEFVKVSQDLYRTGGYRAFWVGIGPTMLRALPTNAVLFIVYETTKSALIDWGL
ncbi:hypothetical protein OC834_001755 [Tilletia horrida]|nr:hypothetical protein OC834_001755 [Tilletia horrida]